MKRRILSIVLVLFLVFSNGIPALGATGYTIHSTIPVYSDSDSAAQRTGSGGSYEAGTYFLLKTVSGMHNISPTVDDPGVWINPAENLSVLGIWEITADVNFRSGPSTTYPVTLKLVKGNQVELINKTTSTWYEVRLNGSLGFVHAKYLREVAASDPSARPEFLETISNVNFRTGPAVTYPLIKYLLAGTKVELVSKLSKTWYEVRYAGKVGCISVKYLKACVEPVVVDPPLDPAEPTQEVVNHPYLTTLPVNFRTGPSTVYPVIKKLDIGTPLEFLAAVKEGWVQVVYSGVTGYVSLKYITPVVLQMPSARPVSVSEGSKTHVLNAQIDVRSGPGTGYAKVGPVYPGDFVGVLSINNSWAKINYYDQSVLKNGYLNTSFISPQATTEGGIPRIGIVYTTSKLTHYIDAIKRAGGEAVLLPMAASKAHAEELAASVSGLLLPGGNSSSDSDSFMIQAALAMDKPTLGICLGFQAINSASGGGLSDLVIEDFERSRIHRDPDIRAYRHHKIVIQDDSILAGLVGTGTDVVNSFHRHILSSGGANIETMAMSPDGAIEGIQRKDKTFVIGVAFHPERLYAGGNTIYHSLFIELIRQARLQ